MQRSNTPLVLPSKLTSEDDEVIIEDEGGRVKLTGEHLDVAQLVTGGLRVMGYGLRVTGYRVEVPGYGHCSGGFMQ